MPCVRCVIAGSGTGGQAVANAIAQAQSSGNANVVANALAQAVSTGGTASAQAVAQVRCCSRDSVVSSHRSYI